MKTKFALRLISCTGSRAKTLRQQSGVTGRREGLLNKVSFPPSFILYLPVKENHRTKLFSITKKKISVFQLEKEFTTHNQRINE